MLIVHMLADWRGELDARGDYRVYPKGWTGEMDDDSAAYCIAAGHARGVGPLPEAAEVGIAVLREVVAALTAQNINATMTAVYDAVGRIATQQAAEVARPVPEMPNADPSRGDTLLLAGDGAAAAAAASAGTARARARVRKP